MDSFIPLFGRQMELSSTSTAPYTAVSSTPSTPSSVSSSSSSSPSMSSSTSRSVPALSQVSRNDFDFPSSSSSSSLLPSSSEHHRTPLRQFDTPHRGRYSLVTTLRSTSKHREPSAFHPPHLSFVQCELQVESALAVLTAEAAAAAERAAATTPITNGSIAAGSHASNDQPSTATSKTTLPSDDAAAATAATNTDDAPTTAPSSAAVAAATDIVSRRRFAAYYCFQVGDYIVIDRYPYQAPLTKLSSLSPVSNSSSTTSISSSASSLSPSSMTSSSSSSASSASSSSSRTIPARYPKEIKFRHLPSRHLLLHHAPGTLSTSRMPTQSRSGAPIEVGDDLSVLIGFVSGDLFLHPLLRKQDSIQLNADGVMHKAAVTALTVVPASTQHVGSKQSHATSASRSPSSSPIPSGTERIMAGFVDGFVMLLDLRRRDAPRAISIPESKRLIVMRCNTTTNPLSIWRVSNSSITDIKFSPNGEFVAIAAQDGIIRVFLFDTEVPVCTLPSYYGGVLCLAWSDDGRFLLAGGEDDLVSIWYFPARRLVARCEGHCGYVSSVHFEPRTAIDIACNRYRFASAGQDTNMLLWQFHERELDLEYDPASITDLMTVQREECYTKVPLIHPIAENTQAHAMPLSSIVCYSIPEGVAYATSCIGGRVHVWYPASAKTDMSASTV